ncbi:MAG: hypothetical protein HGA49_11805 [Eubacteriaceae bacterium]|nr:hypothetical protein [Eubacteriaceae bacterium]
MKNIVKDVLFGVLVVIVITILEFIVTIPFGLPAESIDREMWANFISRELLVTALPAFLTTTFFAWRLKTKSNSDALRKGLIWTAIIALNFVIIGLGNDNLGLIFGKIGIYVLLACAFAGPVLYSKVKRLN